MSCKETDNKRAAINLRITLNERLKRILKLTDVEKFLMEAAMFQHVVEVLEFNHAHSYFSFLSVKYDKPYRRAVLYMKNALRK